MPLHQSLIQRIQRFSAKDVISMLASSSQKAAESHAERLLAELEKTHAGIQTAVATHLDKAQEIFSHALPLVVKNILQKSGTLTLQMLENDMAMTTVAHTAYTLMPSIFRLVVNEATFTKLVLQSRSQLVEYLERLEQAQHQQLPQHSSS
ncbi:MAG: hypothetical protein NZ661_03615 [Candidatus Kapabacteria bacterium]|nr:hypothetical protein [Candidatus Kapabacteria bacterium]